MTIRRHISLIILALCALTAPAHAQLIFTPDSWDFGTISETDGRVSHTFTGENRSDKPVVILDVVTTCGCTVPEFTKRPIRPSEKTTIKVTFDPTNRPGAFTKELGVYSSERRKIATLTVRGSVTPRTKTTEELYPVDAGGGLRLASTLCTFSYIREGQQVQSAIGCINTSNRPVRLELHSKESSGLLAADYPRELAPGQTAEINLMYLNPEGAPRYGSLRDALEVRADGRGNGTLIVAHGIGIDKSPADARRTPKVQITENIIKFGPVKHNAPQQQRTFTLTNTRDDAHAGTAHPCRQFVHGQGDARPRQAGIRRSDRFRDDHNQRSHAPDAAAAGDGDRRRLKIRQCGFTAQADKSRKPIYKCTRYLKKDSSQRASG